MGRRGAERAGSRRGDFLAGKYLLGDCLGVGGMGEVYRATNMSLGRDVAIKILSKEYVENENDVLRFLREARAAAAVRHPNVVDVLDVARDEDGTPFIVQELLSGQDLEQHLQSSGGRLSVAEILDIVIAVSDGVAAAHERGFVHRDLKPANVFLSRKSGKLEPKVLDFGACLYETMSELSKEERRTLIGTPHYMSPEQIATNADVDARSDVWALGVMIYELFVGETPFEGETMAEVMRHVRTKQIPSIRDADRHAPEVLAKVIARCLDRDRTKRFVDAKAVRDALAAAKESLDGAPPAPKSRPKILPREEEPTPSRPRVPAVALEPSRERRGAEKHAEAPPKPRDVTVPAKSASSLPPVLDPRAAPPTSASLLPPVLDPRAAQKPAQAAKPPPPKPPPPKPSAPKPTPQEMELPKFELADEAPPPKAAAAAEPPPAQELPASPPRPRRADGEGAERPLPRDEKLWLAGAVIGPAIVAFGGLRLASFLTAPIGRAMRGESMIASGALAVVSLVAAAALAAKSMSPSRTRGVVVAAVSALLVGILMIIVTFAASDGTEAGTPTAISSIVSLVAPLVPIGLASVPLARAREAWFYGRREAFPFVALTALLILAALELSPIGAFRLGR